MIAVRNLRLELGESEDVLRKKAAKELRIFEAEIKSLRLTKKSLDARKKNDLHYICTAAVTVRGDEAKIMARSKSRNVSAYEEFVYDIPRVKCGKRPVIVGFGPGGMFAALVLSMAGARPIVIERGSDAVTRAEKVERFRSGGRLDPECNVQFGEGGAGTFSDGKLNTGIKDKRISWMLKTFTEHGAPEHILWDAKPHIGTDVLINVVQSIRRRITELGGEVRFDSRMTGLKLHENRVCGIEVECGGESYALECDSLILAIGHSARDTFELLNSLGVPMEAKDFSMGVRIEHKQSAVNEAQYGADIPGLPAADYALNVHLPDGSSAYTFCMCPGGEVIAAASEEGGVVTNGMSLSRRDGENANAALLVTLRTESFPYDGVLGGMYWQREIERRAFEVGGAYRAPAQTVGDFLRGVPSKAPGGVKPGYRPGVHYCDLHEVLPECITSVMEKALPELGKKLRGFDSPEAVMTAPETRSSSPVRILRNERHMSELRGLYPCGEGAGYAGGITSAAVDGMKCAEALLEELKNE
ncbi:MAG: hypothetical protein HUJ66_06025 [Oscillospiraceae bacterium]|nr:hypothetical protein [Oscillospiraceae bacterium]